MFAGSFVPHQIKRERMWIGPIALLSGLNPRPLGLDLHFFAVAIYGVGRLLPPYPSPKRMWIGARLIYRKLSPTRSFERYYCPMSTARRLQVSLEHCFRYHFLLAEHRLRDYDKYALGKNKGMELPLFATELSSKSMNFLSWELLRLHRAANVRECETKRDQRETRKHHAKNSLRRLQISKVGGAV
ncbi:Squalene monooxygenase SE1-like protein [Drosera capensis]